MRRYLTSRPYLPIASLVSTPLIVGTTPGGFPSSWIPSGASGAWIQCDSLSGGVKFAFGTNPNTLWGLDLMPGHIFEIRDSPEMLASIRFVRASGTDGRITFHPFLDP
jgi:hypothetical protein